MDIDSFNQYNKVRKLMGFELLSESKYKIIENYQKALSKFKDDDKVSLELIEYVKNNIFNPNYIYLVCLMYKNDTFNRVSVDDIIKHLEFYLKTKTYLTIDLNNDYINVDTLVKRNKLFTSLKDALPKLFFQNNQDIRGPYGESVNFDYFLGVYGFYNKKPDKIKQKVDSLVCAKNKSIDELIDILEPSEINQFDESVTKEFMENILSGNDDTIPSDYIKWVNKDKTKFFLKIEDEESLGKIGSSSFWCHVTEKNPSSNFYKYSIMGDVFILVDTNDTEERNLMTLTKMMEDEDDFILAKEYIDNENEEYYDNVNNGDYDEILYDKLNRSIDNPHHVLFDFFETKDFGELMEILDY